MELVLSLLEQALFCLPWLHQLSQPTKPQQLVLKRPTLLLNLLLIQQTSLEKNESDFSSSNSANASLEKKEEKPATEATTPAASPADSAPQTGQDRSSEPTTSTSPATTETKAEEPIEDNYFRIHVKKLPQENQDSQGLWTWDDVENHLRTGQMVPSPSRMPRKTTTATT